MSMINIHFWNSCTNAVLTCKSSLPWVTDTRTLHIMKQKPVNGHQVLTLICNNAYILIILHSIIWFIYMNVFLIESATQEYSSYSDFKTDTHFRHITFSYNHYIQHNIRGWQLVYSSINSQLRTYIRFQKKFKLKVESKSLVSNNAIFLA